MVEKPGRKIRLRLCRSSKCSLLPRESGLFDGLGANPLRAHAAPSSAMIRTMIAFLTRASAARCSSSACRLPDALPATRRRDRRHCAPGGPADRPDPRSSSCRLRFLSPTSASSTSCRAGAKVARNPRILLEQPTDGLHPRLHHRNSADRNQQIELADRLVERVQVSVSFRPARMSARRLVKRFLVSPDFARQVEHLIEPRRIERIVDSRAPAFSSAPSGRSARNCKRPGLSVRTATFGREVRRQLRRRQVPPH